MPVDVFGTPNSVVDGSPVWAAPALTNWKAFAEPPGVVAGTPVIGAAVLPYMLAEPPGVTAGAPVLAAPTAAAVTVPKWDNSLFNTWNLDATATVGRNTVPWGAMLWGTVAYPKAVAAPGKYFEVTLTEQSNAGNNPAFQIGLSGFKGDPDVGIPARPKYIGVHQTGYIADEAFVNYGDLGPSQVGDVFRVRLSAGVAYFSKNGGAELAAPLGNVTANDLYPVIFAVEPIVGITTSFAGWAAGVATTIGVTAGRPVWGAPALGVSAGLALPATVTAASPVLGAALPTAFAVPVGAWVLTDEVGGPLRDESGEDIWDETRPQGLVALGVQPATAVLGAPLVGGATVYNFVGSTVTAGARVLGSPPLSTGNVVGVVGLGVTAQARVLGVPALVLGTSYSLTALGVTAGAPATGGPLSGVGNFAFAPTIGEFSEPVWGTPLAALVATDVAAPAGVVPGARVVGVAAGFHQGHAAAALGVLASARVLAAPAVAQGHAVAALGLAPAVPVLGHGGLSIHQSLAASGVVAGAAVLATRAIAQRHTVGSPAGVAAQPRVLAAPTAGTRSIHDAIAGAVGKVAGAAVLAAPVLHVRHALAGVGVAAAAPVVLVATWALRHVTAAAGVVAGTRVLGVPTAVQGHAAVAMAVATPVPVVAHPVLHQRYSVTPNAVLAGVPVMPARAVRQTHGVAGVGLATAGPTLGVPTAGLVVVIRYVQGSGAVAGIPILLRPALTGRHAVGGLGVTPAEGPVFGLVGVPWTGLDGGNDDSPPSLFEGTPDGVSFTGAPSRAAFTGRQRTGRMQ